ncbi:MAG: hypothetical protein CMJ49_06225 [Planctomycetaceae bacterium]|nr:hypothetical protein [Planctomycetaceae bacterium]
MLVMLLTGPKDSQPITDRPAANQNAAAAGQAVASDLHARPVPRRPDDPAIGSTDPDPKTNETLFRLQITPWGAGVSRIQLARYGETMAKSGESESEYPLQYKLPSNPDEPDTAPFHYPMAASALSIDDGPDISLLSHKGEPVWELKDQSDRHLTFVATIVDADDNDVLRLTRTYRIHDGRYEITLRQAIENLSAEEHVVVFRQNAQGDLPYKRVYIGDLRRLVLGKLNEQTVDGRVEVEKKLRRTEVKSSESPRLWGARTSDQQSPLMFAAVSNRYFTTAIYRPVHTQGKASDPAAVRRAQPLDDQWAKIVKRTWNGPRNQKEDQQLRLVMSSRRLTLAKSGEEGDAKTLDLNIYAGPKDPKILRDAELHPEYQTVGLGGLIIYDLGSMCSFCTFAWLADGLIWFLRGIEAIFSDWGVAIIVLVIIVRLILHPVTKRSQLHMMRVGKQMAALQPELQALKEKHGDDRQKFAAEQMALMREKGVNPAAMGLGCVPMLLQMPIWIALYAMLYFAIELRHETAFWGFFQMFNADWAFLRDLATQDNFISIGKGFKVPIMGQITAINLLPLLMGVVFYFQQKFMTPTSTAQTEQAKQQQMIMKFTIFLFPVFMYLAPSGLTLYIMASTAAGILDSYIVRKHLKKEEEEGTLFKPREPNKPVGFLGRMQKAADERRKAMEVRAGSSSKQQQPSRKNRKR